MNNSNSQLVTHLPRTSTFLQPKWLNKDRYWNLVFATVMTLGMFAISITPDTKHSVLSPAYIVFWIILIGTPILVRHFNKVTFVEDKKFLTSEGREINVDTDFPSWFIVITIALTMGLGLLLDKNGQSLPETLRSFLIISTIFFIPALCFSFKNCPISILFNLKFWQIEGNNQNIPYSSYEPSRDTYSDRRTNPAYSFQSNNIYYRPHRY